MPSAQPLPTPEIQQQICAFIRAGGFAHVAAEAAGIAQEVFESWLRQGTAARAKRPYREFAEAVFQARAQARLAAELKAFKDKPLDWLKCGPGRETTTAAGWTTAGKARAGQQAEAGNPLLDPDMTDLLRRLLEALAPFPEARAAAAQVLGQQQSRPSRRRKRKP